jgi:D-glycero-D-manno-heptose 1,7-bisphosphate phosphatase
MRGWAWNGYHLDIGSFEQLERARRDAAALAAGRRPDPAAPRRCVFLDSDGTLIEHVHYLSDPRDVRLLPGAATSLQRLHEVGYACVVVTNQSQIGRGWMAEDRLYEIHDEMSRQLAGLGDWVDAIYYSPEAPACDDRTVFEHGDRKPGPGMLRRAARDMGLDLAASWMVGDMISDVLAGINAGCRGSVLVRTGKGLSVNEAHVADEYHIAGDLSATVDLILAGQVTIDESAQADRAAPNDISSEPTR